MHVDRSSFIARPVKISNCCCCRCCHCCCHYFDIMKGVTTEAAAPIGQAASNQSAHSGNYLSLKASVRNSFVAVAAAGAARKEKAHAQKRTRGRQL